jgi:hypothetical protein
MTRLARLRRLERLNAARSVPTTTDTVGIHEELTRDDPARLSAFLQACKRANLLSTYPTPDDDSQLARFLRDVWDSGLLASTSAPKAVGWNAVDLARSESLQEGHRR